VGRAQCGFWWPTDALQGLEVATRYLLPTATYGREEPSCSCGSSPRKGLFVVCHANEEMWEKRSLGTLPPLPPHCGQAAWQGLTNLPGERSGVEPLGDEKGRKEL